MGCEHTSLTKVELITLVKEKLSMASLRFSVTFPALLSLLLLSLVCLCISLYEYVCFIKNFILKALFLGCFLNSI